MVGKSTKEVVLGQLTATEIKALTDAGRYNDGDGLILNVAPGGSKSWILRVQSELRHLARRQRDVRRSVLVGNRAARRRAGIPFGQQSVRRNRSLRPCPARLCRRDVQDQPLAFGFRTQAFRRFSGEAGEHQRCGQTSQLSRVIWSALEGCFLGQNLSHLSQASIADPNWQHAPLRSRSDRLSSRNR